VSATGPVDWGPLLAGTAGRAAAFLASLPDRVVGPPAALDDLLAALGGPLPDGPDDPEAVVAALAAGADAGLVAMAGPRYFGFVTGGSLPAAVAADWLATAWDQNAVLYVASPAAAVAEEVAAGWVLDLLGLPDGASVGLVTGGQAANTTCLAAARHHVLAAAGWDVERHGLAGGPPVTVVVGAERHSTIDRSLRLLGIGTGRLVVVPSDDQGRMVVGDLAGALDAVDGPAIVCLQAGNVNTGAFDDLATACEVAGRRGAWTHVDGAFGLWAAASDRRRHLVAGAAAADSWATDAHKVPNVPYDCGLAICAHPASHAAAVGMGEAAYLPRSTGGRRDAARWNPEASRRARGMPLWAALRSLGRSGMADLVDRMCDLAGRFAAALDGAGGAEVLNDVVFNQVLVRFGDDDATTAEVVRRVQDDGTCWLGGTTWHGMGAMRISVCSWATTEADVDRSVEAILRCADPV
jgi:glutamate/tyrosine decarboxylase-like PLP-dependent enzyme